jgi:hypothetical protein
MLCQRLSCCGKTPCDRIEHFGARLHHTVALDPTYSSLRLREVSSWPEARLLSNQ